LGSIARQANVIKMKGDMPSSFSVGESSDIGAEGHNSKYEKRKGTWNDEDGPSFVSGLSNACRSLASGSVPPSSNSESEAIGLGVDCGALLDSVSGITSCLRRVILGRELRRGVSGGVDINTGGKNAPNTSINEDGNVSVPVKAAMSVDLARKSVSGILTV
jgi:hypothetical protein